jgi:hypothetical protein
MITAPIQIIKFRGQRKYTNSYPKPTLSGNTAKWASFHVCNDLVNSSPCSYQYDRKPLFEANLGRFDLA